MHILRALNIALGAAVKTPAIEGYPAAVGRVIGIDRRPIRKSVDGQDYIYLKVEANGRRQLWPSHMLQKDH